MNQVPFTTTLGDFIAIVDLVARLLEEAVELQRTINSLALSYVQATEERSREAVGTDYIGDAMHAVWQVRGSTGIGGGEEAATAFAAYDIARMKQSNQSAARVYQSMPNRRGATIGPGTWADWAHQQFVGLRRQQAMQANTISPQRGTISDDVTNGAFGRRRPRLITFQSKPTIYSGENGNSNGNTESLIASTSTSAPLPPPPTVPITRVLTARDVLLNRAGWTPSGDDTSGGNDTSAAANDASAMLKRRETIAAMERNSARQRASWWWPQPLAAYFVGTANTVNSGSSSSNNGITS
ncbi:hypothetical protein BDF19DRAFT_282519 [Syncephalis fuscata]|nr:hypothetical protein BDF19DRAFT_282519 [Syncephalis fuscata]